MVSVVIPVLDEERVLAGCLDSVLPGARRVGAEVILVDGGSRDGTVALARERDVRVVSAETGRGRQMNAGAREAAGSLLVFLAADTRLPDGALDTLDAVDLAGQPRAGGFRQRFDTEHRVLRVVSFLHNRRARLTGVFYGDQTPFVRKDVFERLGGFREDMNMEDVEFGSRLRRGEKPKLLDLTATTSARRFLEAGPLRATAKAGLLLTCWVLFRRVPRSRTFFRPVRRGTSQSMRR